MVQVTSHSLAPNASAVADPGYCNSPCKWPFVKLSSPPGMSPPASPSPQWAAFSELALAWAAFDPGSQEHPSRWKATHSVPRSEAEPGPPLPAWLTRCAQVAGHGTPGFPSLRAWTFFFKGVDFRFSVQVLFPHAVGQQCRLAVPTVGGQSGHSGHLRELHVKPASCLSAPSTQLLHTAWPPPSSGALSGMLALHFLSSLVTKGLKGEKMERGVFNGGRSRWWV